MKKPTSPKRSAIRSAAHAKDDSPSRLIDERIEALGDWRGTTLARIRAIIKQADPDVVEEWKWRGVPVWSHGGILCTGETYKEVVKLTFAKGAALPDPSRLFNASLDGNTRRAIDIREGEKVDANAVKALIRAAVALNGSATSTKRGAAKPTKAGKVARPARPRAGAEPVLLAGDNPQIAKGHGDGPVQAYIAAMPGWKREIGRRVDAIVTRAVPGVRKAVKWNSPLYGAPGDAADQGWFLGVHCFTKYVKLAFFNGKALRPPPPGESKQKTVRYLDIREGEPIDEAKLAAWVRQASELPGERM